MVEFIIGNFEKGVLGERESNRKKLINKWKPHFPNCTGNEATLLENISRTIGEVEGSINVGGYTDFVLKLVARVYGKLIAKHIVSVQPMMAPTGKIFYLKPEITTGSTQSDWMDMYTSLQDNANHDESKGTPTWNCSIQQSRRVVSDRTAYGWSSTTFDYDGGMVSSPSMHMEIGIPYEKDFSANTSNLTALTEKATDGFLNTYAIQGGAVSVVVWEYTGSVSPAPNVVKYGVFFEIGEGSIHTDWAISGSNDLSTYTKIIGGTDDITEYETYIPNSDLTTLQVKWQPMSGAQAYKYYTFVGTAGAAPSTINDFMVVTEPTFNTGITVDFSIMPTTYSEDIFANDQVNMKTYARDPQFSGHVETDAPTMFLYWKDYASLEAESTLQKVRLNVTDDDIVAVTRKLKTTYSSELEIDFGEYGFGVDFVDEISELMSSEIAAEIDRGIISDLINIAPYKSEWFYEQSVLSGITGEYNYSGDQRDITGVDITGVTADRHAKETLWTKINQMDGIIHKANVYHGANFIVCSTKVGAIIESMVEYETYPDQIVDTEEIGETGRLGRFRVFIDPYLPSNICLMGYNGSNWDSGYIYAPYIVAASNPVQDPDVLFQNTRNFVSRYGTKIITNKKYGVINCVFPTTDEYAVVNED